MGATKTVFFNKRQNETAVLLKAMAHPARIAIMEYLIKADSCVCGALVDVLPLAQPTISQHLKELKTAGLVQGTIEGNNICYCINKNMFKKLQRIINDMAQHMNEQEETCC